VREDRDQCAAALLLSLVVSYSSPLIPLSWGTADS
jgi:hypothetical protein